MRFKTLDEWLAWQETLHPKKIDLGLGRVRTVLDVMQVKRPAPVVITISGTNGKGSSVAFLASVLSTAGYRVGTYTSPHVFRYNERITIDGIAVSDDELCNAFSKVDTIRNKTSLSYFEFGTLAAFQIFGSRELDVAVLEIGLGGRLDAVNVMDADCALVSRIGVDHIEWLGTDREQIGAEKAAIFRAGKPAVCADANPPASVFGMARDLSARLFIRGAEFDVVEREDRWDWCGPETEWKDLPLPALQGRFQIDNAAGVLMVLECLRHQLPVHYHAVEQGLARASLAGRLQVLDGEVQRIFDVAHNPQASSAVAAYLSDHPVAGNTLAVIGMLEDKDAKGVVTPLKAQIDRWYLGSIEEESRGLDAGTLGHRAGLDAQEFDSLTGAYYQAMKDAQPGDRVVVTGSFIGVAHVLASLQ